MLIINPGTNQVSIIPMVRHNEWIYAVAQMNHIPQHLLCLERSIFIDLVGDSCVRPNACVVSECIWCYSMNSCIFQLVHILYNCLYVAYSVITIREFSWLVYFILHSEVFLCFYSRDLISGTNFYRILQFVC